MTGNVVALKKLTPGEISACVEKIRKTYEDYVIKYFKPRSLRQAFETRYLDALKARVDISSFLLAEVSAIRELVEREEQRVQLGPVRPAAEKGPGAADKILEENRARIAGYPDLPFNPDAGEEVRRMAGALSDLASSMWRNLGYALESTMYAMTSSEMLALDSQLRSLSTADKEEVPSFLSRLVMELRKFPRNFPAIEREEKDYLLQAAFFLHDLATVLERVGQVYTDMAAERRAVVEQARERTEAIITDFRLKDLKRSGSRRLPA